MFICTEKIKPLGTKVQILLPGPQDQEINISATVRSVRYDGEYPIGIGIEFDDLDETSREFIGYVVKKHSRK
jgi:hypothetical protein